MGIEGDKLFDLIVIGAGVNGTGVARDAAMRGLSVLLIDKRDICSGATGTCSGMIHGGARYLLHDLKVTKLSCLDSGYIQRIAPHMLFRIPFLAAVPAGRPFARQYLELMEVYFEAYDRYQPLKNGKPHTRLSPREALDLEPGLSAGIAGAVTFDEWGIDPFRLCVENAKSAVEHGAVVKTHVEVKDLIRVDGAVAGVTCRDRFAGERSAFRSRLVVNTTGPWSMAFSKRHGVEVRLRPAKGVHLVYGHRLSNWAIVAAAVDGRQLFICPHQKGTIVGTTDDDYYGDLDNVTATEDDVQYLLQGVESVFPGIREHRVIRTMAGVRPTLYEGNKYEDDLTREHAIFDHEVREGLRGLLSMAGGKLASYRLMSEELTDLACAKLGVHAACRTHVEPLPGGDETSDAGELAREFGVEPFIVERMVYRHGSRARKVLEIVKSEPRQAEMVCRCDPVTEAELRYCIRNEWVRGLSDLRRRTRLGCGPCQGTRCALRAAAVMADELNLSTDEMYAQAFDLLADRWKGLLPILAGAQIQQEEIRMRALFETGRLRELMK
ncbi:MAG: glycerol-3-phosphate dehydrogenase/oxidase [Deltaproteobacteria bacterium]|nr:glycerol-3-phosphate dehydrogenase/oxidase [Deltaproteobacteria bacterium]